MIIYYFIIYWNKKNARYFFFKSIIACVCVCVINFVWTHVPRGSGNDPIGLSNHGCVDPSGESNCPNGTPEIK